ncbi:MAG: hypothetical protein U0U70_15260 [Chitinophagaceae bacterium]
MIASRNSVNSQAGKLHVVRDEPSPQPAKVANGSGNLVLYPGPDADRLLDAYPVYSFTKLIFHRKFVVEYKARLMRERIPDLELSEAKYYSWAEEMKSAQLLGRDIETNESLQPLITDLIKENVSLYIILITNVMIPSSKKKSGKYDPYFEIVEFFMTKTLTGQFVKVEIEVPKPEEQYLAERKAKADKEGVQIEQAEVYPLSKKTLEMETLKFEEITGTNGWKYIIEREKSKFGTGREEIIAYLIRAMNKFLKNLNKVYKDDPQPGSNYLTYRKKINSFREYLENQKLAKPLSKNPEAELPSQQKKHSQQFIENECKHITLEIDWEARQAFDSCLQNFFDRSPFSWKPGEKKVTFRKPASLLGRALNYLLRSGRISGHDDKSLTQWIQERVIFVKPSGERKETIDTTLIHYFGKKSLLSRKQREIIQKIIDLPNLLLTKNK